MEDKIAMVLGISFVTKYLLADYLISLDDLDEDTRAQKGMVKGMFCYFKFPLKIKTEDHWLRKFATQVHNIAAGIMYISFIGLMAYLAIHQIKE